MGRCSQVPKTRRWRIAAATREDFPGFPASLGTPQAVEAAPDAAQESAPPPYGKILQGIASCGIAVYFLFTTYTPNVASHTLSIMFTRSKRRSAHITAGVISDVRSVSHMSGGKLQHRCSVARTSNHGTQMCDIARSHFPRR